MRIPFLISGIYKNKNNIKKYTDKHAKQKKKKPFKTAKLKYTSEVSENSQLKCLIMSSCSKKLLIFIRINQWKWRRKTLPVVSIHRGYHPWEHVAMKYHQTHQTQPTGRFFFLQVTLSLLINPFVHRQFSFCSKLTIKALEQGMQFTEIWNSLIIIDFEEVFSNCD